MGPVFSTIYMVSCVGPKSGSLQYQMGHSTAVPLLEIEELQTDVRVVTDTSAVTGANLFFCDELSRLAKILAKQHTCKPSTATWCSWCAASVLVPEPFSFYVSMSPLQCFWGAVCSSIFCS